LTDKALKVCIDVVIANLGMGKGFLWLKIYSFKVREQEFWKHPNHCLGVGYKTFALGILFLNHMLVEVPERK